LAVFFVLTQFFLMGRNPWLEKKFGLPALSGIHHTSGLLAFIFIVAHPVLLSVGYAGVDKVSLSSQFLDFLNNYPFVILAFFGFLAFVTLTLLSLYKLKRKLPYETWYGIHLLAYTAVVLAFFHQLAVGERILSLTRCWFGYGTFVTALCSPIFCCSVL